jgi:hypothetical protein
MGEEEVPIPDPGLNMMLTRDENEKILGVENPVAEDVLQDVKRTRLELDEYVDRTPLFQLKGIHEWT